MSRLVSPGGTKDLILLLRVFVTQERIELNPRHVGFRDIGHMTPGTIAHGRFRGRLRIGQWVMPESEEAPAVGVWETLAVFHRCVNAVELAVEKSTSGGFLPRAVRKGRA